MRPVSKGEWPTHNGARRVYRTYADARGDLIDRLGDYCSYCERQLSSIHVEHVSPKTVHGELVTERLTDWSNLLLACQNCNTTKNNRNYDRNGYAWPDEYNTFVLFTYDEVGKVSLSDQNVDPELSLKAQNIYDLVGLGKKPTLRDLSNGRPDMRMIKRKECWEQASIVFNTYNLEQNESYLPIIGILAKNTGFFSIWMQVFSTCPEVQEVLIQSIPGTNRIYFSN